MAATTSKLSHARMKASHQGGSVPHLPVTCVWAPCGLCLEHLSGPHPQKGEWCLLKLNYAVTLQSHLKRGRKGLSYAATPPPPRGNLSIRTLQKWSRACVRAFGCRNLLSVVDTSECICLFLLRRVRLFTAEEGDSGQSHALSGKKSLASQRQREDTRWVGGLPGCPGMPTISAFWASLC